MGAQSSHACHCVQTSYTHDVFWARIKGIQLRLAVSIMKYFLLDCFKEVLVFLWFLYSGLGATLWPAECVLLHGSLVNSNTCRLTLHSCNCIEIYY